MKHALRLLSLLVIVAVLAACQPAAPATPAATEAPTAASGGGGGGDDAFKVGLLSPGPVHDQGWNQIAFDAVNRMKDELGAEISYVELEESPAAFEKAFRDYASQGYDMILAHGFQFQDAAVTVAKEYPDTFFFVSSSRYYNNDNVIGLNTDSSQPFYLFGVITAMMGTGGGLVGGVDIPPISESFTGFINGARSVDPNFKVSNTYLGNWTDVAAAKEAALSMVAEGANFLAPNANIAGNGVYQACIEENVWCFGTFGDNTAQAPKNIVANYISDYGQGLVNIAKEVKEGTFKPTGNIDFGLESPDVIYITYNEGADLKITDEVKQAVEAAKKDIIDGKVDTMAPVE